jgi:hypothetical protein
MVAAIQSRGDAACRANNANYRLDTMQAREFLGRYLTLP